MSAENNNNNNNNKIIKIEFYLPAKNKEGKDIDIKKVDAIINQIWPLYRGGTKIAGTGYYHSAQTGENEIADSFILSVATTYTESLESELKSFKQKIKEELDQEDVLITGHFIDVF